MPLFRRHDLVNPDAVSKCEQLRGYAAMSVRDVLDHVPSRVSVLAGRLAGGRTFGAGVLRGLILGTAFSLLVLGASAGMGAWIQADVAASAAAGAD